MPGPMPTPPIQGLKNAAGNPLLGGATTIQAAPAGDVDPSQVMRGEMPFLGGGGFTPGESPFGVQNEFEPWRGAKNIMNMGRSALDALKGAFGMAPEAAPAAQAAPLAQAPAALRQPKPGGVLYDVLERAGAKQGMGFGNTPGETRLLNQFNPLKGQ